MKSSKIIFLLLTLILVASAMFAQPATWSSRGIGGGGAIQHPAISPHDPDRVFLSCDMSQMFETTDFGLHWNTQGFLSLGGGLRGKVIFTNDPQLLFALSVTRTGAMVPKKSSDGGTTWVPLSPNPCVNNGAFQMYVNPNDPLQFVLSDRINIYFTRDGGLNYATIDTDNVPAGIHLAGAFFDNGDIYVATNNRMIISYDGGVSFPSLFYHSSLGMSVNEGVASFTGANEGGTTKLFCTTMTAATLTCKTYGSDVNNFVGLYKMTNPLSQWQNITSNLSAATSDVEKAYYVRMLPGDTDTLYLGGNITIGGNTRYGTVYKSTDGGTNWVNLFLNNTIANSNTDITTGWVGHSSTANYPHGWNNINTTEGLCIDPHNRDRIIMTDKSNIHYSLDGGGTWSQMYIQPADATPANQSFAATKQYATTGLETTVSYWMAWVDSLHLITASADITAIQSSDGGQKWGYDYDPTNVFAGAPLRLNDISIIEKSPATGILYAGVGDVVGSNGVWDDSRLSQSSGRLCFSTNGGASWQIMHDFLRPVTFLHFYPGQADTLFACVQSIEGDTIGGIYRCDNVSLGAAAMWTKLVAPSRVSHRPSSVYVIAGDTLMASYYPFDSTGNYNYAQRSGVFVSEDGGQTWLDRTDTRMLYKTYRVIPDPNDASGQTWLACVGAGGVANASGLYRSDDRGQHWTNLTPNIETTSCTFHPTLPNVMYICTEFDGLYYATQTNGFSPVVTQLTNYAFRNPQRVFFNPYDENEVWVTSFGNGLKVGHTTPVVALQSAVKESEMLAYPNPTTGPVQLQWPGEEIASIRVLDAQGRVVLVQRSAALNIGHLPSGVYSIVLDTETARFCSRVLKL